MEKDRRNNRLAIAQQQLNLLQQYGQAGTAGLAALDQLREIILQVSEDAEESFQDNFFRYRVGGRQLCFANWHRNGLQIFFDHDGSPLVFEIDHSTPADWDGVRAELLRGVLK